MKQIIKLTESDLHNIVKESVNNILNEETIKRNGAKVARVLRSFGLSWAESQKYGKKICQDYMNPTEMNENGIVSCLKELMDDGEFTKYFETSNYHMHNNEYGDDYYTYDIMSKATGEVFNMFEYI